MQPDPVVFSAEWFERHQGKLLWLLNHWLTRRWFRWVLRIRRCDIGYVLPIVEIFPHAYTVFVRDWGDGKFATDFRTHNKYAKRLYYAFKSIWVALHSWDELIGEKSQLAFGFATLTAFPDASSGATTVDGEVKVTGADQTLTAIRAAAGTAVDQTSDINSVGLLKASTTLNQFAELWRSIFTFDTSLIGASSSITSATFSLQASGVDGGLGNPATWILSSATPAASNNLINADYGQLGSTSFGSISQATFASSLLGTITLNASGIANINRSGISAFGGMLDWDFNNSFTGTWASAAFSDLTAHHADAIGTTNDPSLVVTYRLGNKFTNQTNSIRPRLFRPGMAR